ncbi:hypothetical protein ACJX0J_025319, partial [Zea mays]
LEYRIGEFKYKSNAKNQKALETRIHFYWLPSIKNSLLSTLHYFIIIYYFVHDKGQDSRLHNFNCNISGTLPVENVYDQHFRLEILRSLLIFLPFKLRIKQLKRKIHNKGEILKAILKHTAHRLNFLVEACQQSIKLDNNNIIHEHVKILTTLTDSA